MVSGCMDTGAVAPDGGLRVWLSSGAAVLPMSLSLLGGEGCSGG